VGASRAQAADRLAKLTPALELASLAKADLIIEAVFENMALKKEIFAKLDASPGPERSSPPTRRRSMWTRSPP
jgi:3-hydroxyacyl-CoA dehydrogenase